MMEPVCSYRESEPTATLCFLMGEVAKRFRRGFS